MSTKFTIPEQGYEGLKTIGELSEEQFSALAEAMKSFRPSVYHSRTLEKLIAKAIGKESAALVRDTLSGFSFMYEQVAPTVGDFWGAMSDHLSESAEEQGITAETERKIVERLPVLLQNEAFALSVASAKAMSELPFQFTKASTSVDLRPVFFPDSNDPKGLVLVSSLRLEAFDDEDSHNVVLSLDEIDIDQLIKELEGLKERVEKLKAVARQTDVPLVPINELRREK
ncbi:hypothetical protein [Paraburkholderia tropica]|uniref:hypothetical protein n=1 Tax=Paraburkholderia tropica TaxID=92647 RepID=UPI0031D2908E